MQPILSTINETSPLTVSHERQKSRDEELALETLFQLHQFLSTHNKNPSYTAIIRDFNTLPRSAAKCRLALSFLPVSGSFDGGNYKISTHTQLPHFQIADLPKWKEGSQLPDETIKHFFVTVTARKALCSYADGLAKSEALANRGASRQIALFKTAPEPSCLELLGCSLF